MVNVGALPPRPSSTSSPATSRGGADAGSFNTAVNFQINVLDSVKNGAVSSSIVSGSTSTAADPPTMLDLTFRYTKANNDLFILVQDDGGNGVRRPRAVQHQGRGG